MGWGPARNGARVSGTPDPHQTLRSLPGRPSAGTHPAVPWHQQNVHPPRITQALGVGGWPGSHATGPGTLPWINGLWAKLWARPLGSSEVTAWQVLRTGGPGRRGTPSRGSRSPLPPAWLWGARASTWRRAGVPARSAGRLATAGHHRWPPLLATTTTARRWPHGSAQEQRLCLTPPAGPVGKSACRPERALGSRDRGQEEVGEGPFRHMRFGPSTRRLGKQALSAALSSWGRASGCVFSARLPPDGLGAGRRVTGPRRHRGC